MPVHTSLYGKLKDGSEVQLFSLSNSNGVFVDVITYGGTVTSIRVPDKNGHTDDVVLGFDSLADYETKNGPYLGVLVGRYGNRIAKGKFSLDGKEYTLAQNNGPNTLHGGIKGFDKLNWSGKAIDNGVELSLVSPDGDEGYPGNLTVTVKYELNEENELTITYGATTDAPTVVNFTNHSYFNLAGSGNVFDHELKLYSSTYTPVGEDLIPTGAIEPVKGTPFDFVRPHTIGARIAKVNNGYDHNFAVSCGRTYTGRLVDVARVYEPKSGRSMEVKSTEPGVQLYTGGFLDGTLVGRGGKKIEQFAGFCLETQHFPDSPNQSSFPTTVLRPGEEFSSTTIFKFHVPRAKRKSGVNAGVEGGAAAADGGKKEGEKGEEAAAVPVSTGEGSA